MSRVGVVTDSTSCLSPELLKEYDIRIVPTGLVINGKVYRDQVDITNAEFWKLFYEAKELPTTAAVSPGDYVVTYTDLLKSYDSILCISLSGVLSATYDAAVQAKELLKAEHPGVNIEVIDSKTATGALGFIALEAARAARAGKSLDEVAQVAHSMIPRVKFFVAMETLRYLIRTGRAPKVAMLGELMQVKPIVGMVSGTGEVEPLCRVRGKRKSILKMLDMVQDYADVGKPIHFMVHYTDSLEEGEELKKMVASRFNCLELYLTPYTPVMASATGPVLALSFY